jgi:hypothetical protein
VYKIEILDNQLHIITKTKTYQTMYTTNISLPIELVNNIYEMICYLNNDCWITQFVEGSDKKIHKTLKLNTDKYKLLNQHLLTKQRAVFTMIYMDSDLEWGDYSGVSYPSHYVELNIKLNENYEPFTEDDYEDESINYSIMLIQTQDEYNNYVYIKFNTMNYESSCVIFNPSNKRNPVSSINNMLITENIIYLLKH